jgi:hypothetical protein
MGRCLPGHVFFFGVQLMVAITQVPVSLSAVFSRSFAAAAVVLIFCGQGSYAWARLGETPEQIEARYGRPAMEAKKLADFYTLPVRCFWHFRPKSDSNKFETSILVTYRNGRCVREEYTFKDDTGKELEIRDVLEHANSIVEAHSAGHKWNFIPVGLGELGSIECGWERADGQAGAIVNKNNKTVLEIGDTNWSAEEARARQNAKAGAGGF